MLHSEDQRGGISFTRVMSRCSFFHESFRPDTGKSPAAKSRRLLHREKRFASNVRSFRVIAYTTEFYARGREAVVAEGINFYGTRI